MTMGTASTTAIAVLDRHCPGHRRFRLLMQTTRMATNCGRRIAEMVWEDLKGTFSLKSFENAITADMAIGGSTNAIIHSSHYQDAQVSLELEKFDEISSTYTDDREPAPIR
jgi:dihydroxy-acid dehydratase